MTGGIGFSRDGNNTLKKNKSLLGSRKTNAENPYWGTKKYGKRSAGNFSELSNWKQFRAAKIRKRTIFIFAMLSLLASLIWLFL